MAKKITRSRPWTKEEARMLKSLAREKTKTVLIAERATYQKALALGVTLAGGRGRKRV